MDLSALVLQSGSRCAAYGRVVHAQGRIRFEPPLPRPLVRPLGAQPAPTLSAVGVDLVGVDSAGLLDRRQVEGAWEGHAMITGSWEDGRVRVVQQRAERPEPEHPGPEWLAPPCPAPAGGWPAGEELEVPPQYEALQASGAAVTATVFRPPGRGPVLVVAAAERERVLGQLEPLMGDRVCVVRSAYTLEQVRGVRDELRSGWSAWQLYETGTSSTPQGQVEITVRAVHLVQRLADRARTWPPGLVSITPWLQPALG